VKTIKLLIHACCAPCASAVLEKLAPDYELTLLYFNPNIQPESEYQRRLAQFVKLKQLADFELIAAEYDPQEWLKLTDSLATEPEGGARCQTCFDHRLTYTAELIDDHDAFATTLSISPHKNLEQINSAGRSAASRYDQTFLEFDFRDLYQRSVELSAELDLYRQKYCGCLYAEK